MLLDCRFDLAAPEAGRKAYLEAHIPGALYADLNQDLSATPTAHSGRHPLPDPKRFAAWLRSLGVGPATLLVAYDEGSAAFAARAWWLARWIGHEPVAVLDGGLRAWVEHGGCLESGAPATAAREAGPHEATTRGPGTPAGVAAGATVDSAEVQRALGCAARLIVDARAPARFAGRVEPVDPVAGHIPGAVNHPYTDNLGPDGRFLPRTELARRWRARLAGHAPRDVIAMCGSGVTACQNLLALEVAGLPGAKLYPGSWSEWIRDPSRPIARES